MRCNLAIVYGKRPSGLHSEHNVVIVGIAEIDFIEPESHTVSGGMALAKVDAFTMYIRPVWHRIRQRHAKHISETDGCKRVLTAHLSHKANLDTDPDVQQNRTSPSS